MWKELIEKHVAEYRTMMLDAAQAIWEHPQTGYKEWFANDYLKERFMQMGFKLIEAGNIPGFYFDIETGRPGPCVCLMGELDSVICPEHPEADPVTGAVHACGHNCQSATLLGMAGVLAKPDVLEKLSGSIRIMAVPAEELLEIEERLQMRKEGKISYMGGKVEFIHRGYFDGVDMAILMHTGGGESGCVHIGKGYNGCIAKSIAYKGVAAHAGGSPHLGVNALYAAQVGMTAVNALRETFRDNDHIRFHPIMTSGGAIVNAIPSKATLESYVRGASLDAIVAANKRVNRALAAGALALGAQVEIRDIPGYMPLNDDPGLNDAIYDASVLLYGEGKAKRTGNWSTGSTDVGDVSCIMPAIMPGFAGAKGVGHGADYKIVDPESAVVQSAAVQIAATCLLLENGAERGLKVKAEAKPPFASKEAYLEAIENLWHEGDSIVYGEDRSAQVNW